MKLSNERFFCSFWTRESGLSGMLLLLFIMHFIAIPLFGNYPSFMILLKIFWMFFLLAGIMTLAKDKKQALQISILPLLFVLFDCISFFRSDTFIILSDFIFSLASIMLLTALVLAKVLEPGPVTVHRIVGSIVVYMLLIQLWSTVYLFLFKHIENSFQVPASPFETAEQANFLYFSYITITSTGYGEILPLHPLAKSLVQLEVLTGVLYPMVLIGQLVSNATFSRDKKNK